ncbi:DUF1501 domain-containing protein [Lignipirellula cremea]|uniref:Sulfatase n=1 Tax=Lignipirellula cremea TaxID=2528010 RepID=A0A518DKT6_9BACT|nr:DUF1501 domain-containing protein [Lignipirellula cremea]QDU92453.1 hypothetical protein Pla8534_02010 [Lignipirellula cremea]
MPAPFLTRRDMLQSASAGFGLLAFAGLSSQARAAYESPLAAKAPHFAPRAKRVIMMSMRGGPSHVDTFDYKPALAKSAGMELSANGPSDRARGKLLPSPWGFTPCGESGLPISDVYPHLQKQADDICLINSMYTDVPNHPQAFLMMHTGEFRFARPSMGAWVLYGLGSENANLPGFVSINPPVNLGGAQNYASGFLPAIFQGTAIGREGGNVRGATIGNIDCQHLTPEQQRRQLDLVQSLNHDLLARKQQDARLDGVIESYELAFRMQTALPSVLDFSDEQQATLDLYGIGDKGSDNFGRQCLMARRLAESGVRFIEICHGNWDQHGNLKESLGRNAMATDQPMAGLLADLKQRDMLKDTLVIWGGEFGRTPTGQGDNGRNHNATGYSMWLAGGGVKSGLRFGATDEFGKAAVEDKVHPHDLQATILHLLGLDHDKLTYYYGGRDYRLTGIAGDARVVDGIIA